ncbi:MAG: hypothetical protein WC861_03890 [Candidatus Micrarchaeia archaeon]|jgi:hypothetical protein
MADFQKSIQKETQALTAQRSREMRVTAFTVKKLMDERAIGSGELMFGRGEHGAAVETLIPAALNILVDKWYVVLKFMREDAVKIGELTREELEEVLKIGFLPRTATYSSLHIISAVRLLRHVRKGYADELARAGSSLEILDRANLMLSERKSGHSDEELRAAIAVLQSFDISTLQKKRAAVKRLLARESVGEAVSMLETAISMEMGHKRDFQVARACSKFWKARNRVGAYRDRQIINISYYNYLKECSLRKLRDEWLYAQLRKFAGNPAKIHEYLQFDKIKLDKLAELRGMIAAREPKNDILLQIESYSRLFRVPERSAHGADKRIALAEAGVVLPPSLGKDDYQISHYRWLYKFVNRELRALSLKKLGHLELFVHANKPRFILDELQKGHEPYLKGTVIALNSAVLAFEAGNFPSAQDGFIRAAELLQATFQ